MRVALLGPTGQPRLPLFRKRYGAPPRHEIVAFPWHSSPVNSLSIALLGAPRVEIDGRPLVVDTRKATAVLAFLAVTGHTHTRAVIADLLWPDADPERSRSALRRTLSTLRGALGEERLISDRLNVGLNLDGASFDLAEFRSVAGDPAAGIDALSRAAALHRDELLAGFTLRDSAEFDDWQREAQETVRRERATALDRLADLLAREGRFDEAIAGERVRFDLRRSPADARGRSRRRRRSRG